MFHILIVDDDKLIIDDLISLIDWQQIDCFTPDSASNGKQALAMLENKSYDIVLTDIAMPIMDGVELIQEAKAKGIRAIFLVISNYDDFVSVKEAMKYGAVEYLLKYEITAESLCQQIRYAQELVRKQVHNPDSEADVRLLQRQIIRKIYQGESQNDEFPVSDKSGVWVPAAAVLFGRIDGSVFNQVFKLADLSIEESECIAAVSADVDNNKVILLLAVDNPSYLLSLRIVTGFVQAFLKNLKNAHIEAAISIGPICNTACMLKSAIGNMKGASQDYFYMKPYSMNLSSSTNKVSRKMLDVPFWAAKCAERSPEDVANNLYDYFQQEWVDADCVKSGTAKLVATIANSPDAEHSGVSTIWNAQTAWDVCSALRRFLSEQWVKPSLQRESVRMEIARAMQYISEHYSEQITLTKLAETACLSPNYFCRIFKSETGLNYSEYMNRLRLEQAKKLLRSTTMHTNEIAEKVGFKDYRYFCRIFKVYTGFTCSEFRRKHGGKS